MSREATNRILEWVEHGMLDRDNVILCCLKWMSEDDVREMARINEFGLFDDFDDEDEES